MTVQNRTAKGRRKSWEPAFLAALSRSGSVASACRAARIGRQTAYDRRFKDEGFGKRWDSALETFADGLEAEAVRRAVRGVTRYKFYKGEAVLHPDLCLCNHGRLMHEADAHCQEEGCTCSHFLGQPYKERERSDALMALLLKGLRPEKYRDNLGLSAEEVDAYIEKRISELAQERVNQITRNGTVHPSSSARTADPGPAPPPGPATQGAPPPGSTSAGQGTPDPSRFYSDVPPLLPDGFPPRNQANGP
jgi:hypothetical protein